MSSLVEHSAARSKGREYGGIAFVHWLLRLATAGAFIGHGAYGVIVQKPGWYGFFAALGIDQATVDGYSLMQWVGGFEMALGIITLMRPMPAILLFILLWKIATEFIWYPMSGQPAWEFVERWSNYAAPLGLLITMYWPTQSERSRLQDYDPEKSLLGSLVPVLALAGVLMAVLQVGIRSQLIALSTALQIGLSGTIVLGSWIVIGLAASHGRR